MKNKVLYLLPALFMLACHSKIENDPSILEQVLCDSIASIPPLALEMVKFSPPAIKDDAMESKVYQETTPSITNKKNN